MLTVNQLYGNQNFVDDEIKKDISFNLRCCIPGIVQSYNSTNNTAEIQPAIREKIFLENGEARYVDLPLLINVPVAFPSSSSVFIKFPIKQGDEVLVLFSDLSIDNFWEKGKVQNPIESRRHDLSDGIAIPCRLSLQKRYPANVQDGIHINSDGSIRIHSVDNIEFMTRESDTSIDEIMSKIDQLEQNIKKQLIILQGPSDYSGNAGQTAFFSIEASGTGLEYQWQWRYPSGSTWSDSSSSFVGYKSKIMQVPITSSRNGYHYRCKVNDSYGNTVYSPEATLTVV